MTKTVEVVLAEIKKDMEYTKKAVTDHATESKDQHSKTNKHLETLNSRTTKVEKTQSNHKTAALVLFSVVGVIISILGIIIRSK